MNNIARAAGDLALTRRNYEQAVSLYDRLGHRREAAQARNNLGGVLFRQYEIEAADAVWSDALAVLESVGDMVTAADVRRDARARAGDPRPQVVVPVGRRARRASARARPRALMHVAAGRRPTTRPIDGRVP